VVASNLAEEMAELVELFSDPVLAIQTLRIVDKDKKLAWLTPLWEEQVLAIGAWLRFHNIFVLKSRQLGMTTLFEALFFLKYLLQPDPRALLQIGHEKDCCKRMNKQWRTHVEGLIPLLRPELPIDNAGRIQFGHNLATCDTLLAGGKGQARSDTYSDAHFTEMAYYGKGSASSSGSRAETDMDADIWQSVTSVIHAEDAHIVVESTPNGPRGFFYDLYKTARAQDGQSWKLLFFPWHGCARYRLPFDHPEAVCSREDFAKELTDAEKSLQERFDCDLEQLHWRRHKFVVKRFTPRRFKLEFPATEREPWELDDHGWFDHEVLEGDLDLIPPEHSLLKDQLQVFVEYDPRFNYAMGVDTSGGTGGDYLAIQIVRSDGLQCAVFHSNRVGPETAHVWISRLGARYKKPLCIIESNKYGATVLRNLREMGNAKNVRLYVEPETGKDFVSHGGSVRGDSKKHAYSHAREVVNNAWVVFNHPATVHELISIVEKPNGKIEAARGHDDLADALVLVLWATRRWQSASDNVQTERDRYRALRKRRKDPFGRRS